MIIKSILIWLLFVPLAILNGGLREGIIEPMIGSIYANPVSCIILCILIFIVSFFLIPRLGKGERKIYLKIGVLWIFLTILFETVLGLLMGLTINDVINSYNITTGNFWLIVVIFIGFAPLLIAKIRKIP
ncbi:MAG: hypothetical protein FWD87_07885 [Spirochaetaceae bacterium]|nr:hypothetical protein [Spirochaetaceae bacterium]